MPYAAVQDIIDRYSEDELSLAFDRDIDDPIDSAEAEAARTAAAIRALTDSSAEIDGYLVGRYSLPLASAPAILTSLAVDIALYKGSANTVVTEEKRTRYDDAISYLNKVAQGKISLGIEKPSQGGSGGASFTAAPRRMTREGLGRLL